MAEEQELSESGHPIYRHQSHHRDFEMAFGDVDTIEAISSHIEAHIGPIASVYHELLSDMIHLDVYIVRPTPERNFFTLITGGMSDRPMNVTPEGEGHEYAELLVCLPSDWPLSHESSHDRGTYDREEDWPIHWLKQMARLPHEWDSWFGWGHSIPNGDPAEAFPGASLCGSILYPSLLSPRVFDKLTVSPEKTIHFYALWLVYQEEMDYKLRHGAEGLLDRFEKFQVTEMFDLQRINTCRRVPFWKR